MDQKMFYEFVNHEYYALVTVTIKDIDMLQIRSKSNEFLAAEVYAKVVGGDSVSDVLKEGKPEQRTKEYAFEKFIRSAYEYDDNLGIAIKEFDKTEDNVLLIDSSLI